MKPFNIILLLLNLGFVFTVSAQISGLPDARYNLLLKARITTWDEAIPLGNGLMVVCCGAKITPSDYLWIEAICGMNVPQVKKNGGKSILIKKGQK